MRETFLGLFLAASVAVTALFAGHAVGRQQGRDEMCLVARECEPGFSARFVSPGCLCTPKAVRR